jgi:hypothetical protein
VRIFPNAESCLRLVRALAVETHENWLEGTRYLNMDHLTEHKNRRCGARHEATGPKLPEPGAVLAAVKTAARRLRRRPRSEVGPRNDPDPVARVGQLSAQALAGEDDFFHDERSKQPDQSDSMQRINPNRDTAGQPPMGVGLMTAAA